MSSVLEIQFYIGSPPSKLVQATTFLTCIWKAPGWISPITVPARSKAWMSVFVLFFMWVAALRRADRSSKESYCLWKKDYEPEEEARAQHGCRAIDERNEWMVRNSVGILTIVFFSLYGRCVDNTSKQVTTASLLILSNSLFLNRAIGSG
jgi:hypothetical protein